MEIPLRDLLPDAVRRARLTRQVQAHSVVEIVDQVLGRFLPQTPEPQAKAISFLRGSLTIGCLSSATGYFLKQQEEDLIQVINREEIKGKVRRIRIKIIHDLHQEK